MLFTQGEKIFFIPLVVIKESAKALVKAKVGVIIILYEFDAVLINKL